MTLLFPEALLEARGQAGLIPIDREQHACGRCPLASTRIQVVPGGGNPEAVLFFAGEAPGAKEDELGMPFAGHAGKLLDRMIEALGTSREACYVANVLGCRPPGNRKPEPAEIAACRGFLFRRIAAVRPRCVVALGATAAQVLLGTKKGVGELRGSWHVLGQKRDGIPVRCTFHPAFLLRPQGIRSKGLAWEDFKAAAGMAGIVVPGRTTG